MAVTTKPVLADSEQTFRAAVDVLRLLPQFVGILVSVSAVAYFAGLREATAYFSYLGASWAVSLLSSTDIVQRSIPLIYPIAVTIFLVVVGLLDTSATSSGLRRLSLAIGIACVIALFVPLISEPWISPLAAHVSSYIAGVLWAVLAGLGVGQLIARRKEGDTHWQAYHLWMVYLVILYGLWMAPDQMGRSRAELDAHARESLLPRVTSSQLPDTEIWRLVGPLGNQMLVMRPSDEPKHRVFRIVENSDLSEIHRR